MKTNRRSFFGFLGGTIAAILGMPVKAYSEKATGRVDITRRDSDLSDEAMESMIEEFKLLKDGWSKGRRTLLHYNRAQSRWDNLVGDSIKFQDFWVLHAHKRGFPMDDGTYIRLCYRVFGQMIE